MKHLILFAHPNPSSFGYALCSALKSFSESKGNQVTIRNLYEMAFNPILSADDFTRMEKGIIPPDIAQEHAFIREANHITFIYPVWWGGMPAVLKGYVDRVFSIGFAYEYNNDGTACGLLTGKKGSVICTTGATNEDYEKLGMHAAMLLIDNEVIFGFCGITPVKNVFLGNITGVSRSTREGWLADIQRTFAEVL